MSKDIQVVIVEPMKKPYKKMIPNKLEEMQSIVEGYIRPIAIGEYGELDICLIVNEEGLIQKLPVNRRIIGFDTLVGTMFITAYDQNGNNVSLSNEATETYIKIFSSLEVYL
jgi:hypothetical protein